MARGQALRANRTGADDAAAGSGGPDYQHENEEQPASPLADAVDEEAPAATGASDAAIHAWYFVRGEEPGEIPATDLGALPRDDDHFLWVDLDGYGAPALQGLAGELGLPEPAVQSALAGWLRPRLDVVGRQYLVSVTVAHREARSRRVFAGQLDLFVGPDLLVSAHKHPTPFTERVLARARQNPDLIQRDSAFLLFIALDELLAHYEGLAEGLEDAIETVEERALTDASDAFLHDLLELKRAVFAVHRLADQHRALFAMFLRPDFPLVDKETVAPYYRDLEERLGWLLANLADSKDAVNGAFNIYVSRVSHQTNGVMRVLTMVSTTLLPTTVILAFFGTSFQGLPFTTSAAFVVMLLAIVLMTAAILFVFRRWGWLGAPRADLPTGE